MEKHKVTYYSGKIVPGENRVVMDGKEYIVSADKTVFVFGSNPEGRHGAGAAKVAKDYFGAIYGNGKGMQGAGASGASSYALPTKDLRAENKGIRSIGIDAIMSGVAELYAEARRNPGKVYMVAYTNTDKPSLNGYTGYEMMKAFLFAAGSEGIPSNVAFSSEWAHTGYFDDTEKTVAEGFKWGKNSENGYEVSSRGDKRFSAFFAKLSDGRTVEEAYQLDVKGYRRLGYTVLQAQQDRGVHAPLQMSAEERYEKYLGLWRQWAKENPAAIEELREKARGKVLTDMFSSLGADSVNQARALAQILNESAPGVRLLTDFGKPDWDTVEDINRVNTDHVQRRAAMEASKTVSLEALPFGEFCHKVDAYFRKEWDALKKGSAPARKDGLLLGKDAPKRYADYVRMRRAALDTMEGKLSAGMPAAEVEGKFGLPDGAHRILHSGGAPGSDFAWGEIGARYGVEARHYYFDGMPDGAGRHYNALVDAKKFEEYKRELLVLDEYFRRSDIARGVPAHSAGRRPAEREEPIQKLFARDIEQVRNADAVYAVGTFQNMDASVVAGGTGWAVAEGMHVGKPVYFFDQEGEQWYSLRLGMAPSPVAEEDLPPLPGNFAGIGTRRLNAAGLLAIENVYRRTFGEKTLRRVPEADAIVREIGEGNAVDVPENELLVNGKSVTRLSVRGGALQIWSGGESVDPAVLGSGGWRRLGEIVSKSPVERHGKVVTIGHSNLTLRGFVDELARQGVTSFMDVRSTPNSKFVPHFNVDSLKAALEKKGIRYIYAGSLFGGHVRPEDGRGQKTYAEALAHPRVKDGLQWMINETLAGRNVAIGCSEGNVLACHRFWELSYALSHPDLVYGEGAIRVPPEGVNILHCSSFGQGASKSWHRITNDVLERGLFERLGIPRTPDRLKAAYEEYGVQVQAGLKKNDWKAIYFDVENAARIRHRGTFAEVPAEGRKPEVKKENAGAVLYTVGTALYSFRTPVLGPDGQPVLEAYTRSNIPVRNPLDAQGKPIADDALASFVGGDQVFYRADGKGAEKADGKLTPVAGIRGKTRWMTPQDDPGLEKLATEKFRSDLSTLGVRRVIDLRSFKTNPTQPWFGADSIGKLCAEAGAEYEDMSEWFGNAAKNVSGRSSDVRSRIDAYRQKVADIVAGLDDGVPTLILGNRSNPLLDTRSVLAAAVSDPEAVFSGKVPESLAGRSRNVVHITSSGPVPQQDLSRGVAAMTGSGDTRTERMGMWDFVASQIPLENGRKAAPGDGSKEVLEAPWCGNHAIYHISRGEFGELVSAATKQSVLARRAEASMERRQENAEREHIASLAVREDLNAANQKNWVNTLSGKGMLTVMDAFRLPAAGDYPEAEADAKVLMKRFHAWAFHPDAFVSPGVKEIDNWIETVKDSPSEGVLAWLDGVTAGDAREILSAAGYDAGEDAGDAEVKDFFRKAFDGAGPAERVRILSAALTVPASGDELAAVRRSWRDEHMRTENGVSSQFRSAFGELSETGRRLLLERGREMSPEYIANTLGDMSHDIYFAPVYSTKNGVISTSADMFFANLPKVDRVVDLRTNTAFRAGGVPAWNHRDTLRATFGKMGITYECRWKAKDPEFPGPDPLRVPFHTKFDEAKKREELAVDFAKIRADRSKDAGLNWEDRFAQELAAARTGHRTLYLIDSTPDMAAAGLGQAFVRAGFDAGYVQKSGRGAVIVDQKSMIDRIRDREIEGDWRQLDFEYVPKEDRTALYSFEAKPASDSEVTLLGPRRRRGVPEIFPEEKANFGRAVKFTPRGKTFKDGYDAMCAESDATLCIASQMGGEERKLLASADVKGIPVHITDESAMLLDADYIRKKAVEFKAGLAKIYPDGVPEGFVLHVGGSDMNHIANAMSFTGKTESAAEDMRAEGKKVSSMDSVPVMPTGVTQDAMNHFFSLFMEELAKEHADRENVYPPVRPAVLLTGGESGVCQAVRTVGTKYCDVRCTPTTRWHYTVEGDSWFIEPSRGCKSLVVNPSRLGLKAGPLERNEIEKARIEAWNERDEQTVRGDEGFVPGLTVRQMLTLHFVGFGNADIWRINEFLRTSTYEGVDGKLTPPAPGESAAPQIQGLLTLTGDLGDITEEMIGEAEMKADAEMTACHEAGIKIIPCTSPWYPDKLKNLGSWDYEYSDIVEKSSGVRKRRPRMQAPAASAAEAVKVSEEAMKGAAAPAEGSNASAAGDVVYEEVKRHVEQTPPPYLHVDGWAGALRNPVLAVTSETGARDESKAAALRLATAARAKGVHVSTVIMPESGIVSVGEGALRGQDRRTAILTREGRDARTVATVPSSVIDEEVPTFEKEPLAGAISWSPVPMKTFVDGDYAEYRRMHANGGGATVTAGPCITDVTGFRIRWNATDSGGRSVAKLNTMAWSLPSLKNEVLAAIGKTLDSDAVKSQANISSVDRDVRVKVLSARKEPTGASVTDGIVRVVEAGSRAAEFPVGAVPELEWLLAASGGRQPVLSFGDGILRAGLPGDYTVEVNLASVFEAENPSRERKWTVPVMSRYPVNFRRNSQISSLVSSIADAKDGATVADAVDFLRDMVPGVRIDASVYEDMPVSKHDYAYARHLCAASADAAVALEAAPSKYGSLVSEDLAAATGPKYVVDYGSVSKSMSAYLEGSFALRKQGVKGLAERDFTKLVEEVSDMAMNREGKVKDAPALMARRHYRERQRMSLDGGFRIVSYGDESVYCVPAGFPLVEAAIRREYGADAVISHGEVSTVSRQLERRRDALTREMADGMLLPARPVGERLYVTAMEVHDGFVTTAKGLLSDAEAASQRRLFERFRERAVAAVGRVMKDNGLDRPYRFEHAYWADAFRADDRVIVYEGNIVRGEVGLDASGRFYMKGDAGSLLDDRSAAGLGRGGNLAGSRDVFLMRKPRRSEWTEKDVDILLGQMEARLTGNSEAWIQKALSGLPDGEEREEFRKAVEDSNFFAEEKPNDQLMAEDLLAAKVAMRDRRGEDASAGDDRPDPEERKEAVLYVLLEKDGFEKRLEDVRQETQEAIRDYRLTFEIKSAEDSSEKEEEENEDESLAERFDEDTNREQLALREDLDEKIAGLQKTEIELQKKLALCEAKLVTLCTAKDVSLSHGDDTGRKRTLSAFADGVRVSVRRDPALFASAEGKALLSRADTVIGAVAEKSARKKAAAKSVRERKPVREEIVPKDGAVWKVVDKSCGTYVLQAVAEPGGRVFNVLAKDEGESRYRIVSERYDSIAVLDRTNGTFEAKSSRPEAAEAVDGLPVTMANVLDRNGVPAFRDLKVDAKTRVSPLTLVSRKVYEDIAAVKALRIVTKKDGTKTVKECYNFVGKGGRAVLDEPVGTKWFEGVGVFSRGLAAVKRDHRWFFIDAFGSPLLTQDDKVLTFDAPKAGQPAPRFFLNKETGFSEAAVTIDGSAGIVSVQEGRAVFAARKIEKKEAEQESVSMKK